MITRAIVLGKVEDSPNKYWVRIPVFEGTGNSSADADMYEKYAASLCYTPGSLDVIRNGDRVYVSFIDNDYSNIVILGNMYLGDEADKAAHQSATSLSVDGSASLNGNVTINGVSLDKLTAEHSQAISNLNSLTEELSKSTHDIDLGDWIIKASEDKVHLSFYRKHGGNA